MKKSAIAGIVIGLGLVAVGAWQSAANATETINYSYDALGRLIVVTHSGSQNNGQVTNYSFDPNDNRTNVTVTGK